MPKTSAIPSDIIGLNKAAPVSRRNFFMTVSAAAAAGYTLAAGPVRAEAIDGYLQSKSVWINNGAGGGYPFIMKTSSQIRWGRNFLS